MQRGAARRASGNYTVQKAVISATGLFTPEQSISNEELVGAYNAWAEGWNAANAEAIAAGEVAALTPSSAEFIEKASGIKSRFVIDKSGLVDPDLMRPIIPERPNDQISVLAEVAVEAAKQAIERWGKDVSQIGAVICAASNMQRAYPAMAIEIQQALGAGGYGFDMNVACSSATFAIEQAVNAVRTGSARCVLVVNPEITSGHQAWNDRDCHFIFGDVCTAVIVERADTATTADAWEVLGTRLATQFSNNIRNNFGFMNRCEDADPQARDKTFRQEGRKVFKEVVPIAAAHIEGHLAQLALQPDQVRRFWLHQANEGMNQLVIKKLVGTATADRAPLILDTFANTASAGSIIAFHQHRSDLQAGDVGVICSFGAGYSVGSVAVRKL